MSEKRKRHFPKPKTFEEWDQIQDEIRRGVDALYERAKGVSKANEGGKDRSE